MPTYISLLRGINVGGKNIIRMAELRACVERLGHTQVQSYIQSGNLVFRSSARTHSAISKQLATAILEEFDLDIPVISRTWSQLAKVAQSHPLLGSAGVDNAHLAVTFLGGKPRAAGMQALEERARDGESIHLIGSELYLHLPHGAARTKLDPGAVERNLGVKGTSRNWRTVNKLLEMAKESGS